MDNYHKVVWQDVKDIAKEPLPWGQLQNCHILITGGAGYLPAYIVYTLLARNDLYGDNITIHALVRDIERAKKRFSDILERKDFCLIEHDVRNPVEWKGTLDIIIHAASRVSPDAIKKTPIETIETNAFGTYQLLNLAKENNVKSFIYFSSVHAISYIGGKGAILGLLDAMNPRYCYMESKRIGEMLCASFLKQHGVPIKVVRPTSIYGPGIALNDSRPFSDFLHNILNDEDIMMRSKGNIVRSYCYIKDAILGFFYVLMKGQVGQAYNIDDDNGILTVYELAKLMVQCAPERNIKVIAGLLDNKDDVFSDVDIEKIKQLGWHPTTPLNEGMQKTIASFAHGKGV